MDEIGHHSRVQELLHGTEQWWIQQQVDDLGRRVVALREREMRRAVVLERLSSLDDAELVALITVLLARVEDGHPPSRAVLQEMALEPVLFSDMPYERLKDAYILAREEGLEHVATFFLGDQAQTRLTAEAARADNAHLDLPLGLRRAAARTGDRFVLDRLLHDQNHRVIALLLDNPRLIERDVVQIAATRPTQAAVLEQVARHRRWSSRYRVRKALACNPYTPVAIARRLLPTLMKQDLRDLLSTRGVHAELRDAARALLGTTPED